MEAVHTLECELCKRFVVTRRPNHSKVFHPNQRGSTQASFSSSTPHSTTPYTTTCCASAALLPIPKIPPSHNSCSSLSVNHINLRLSRSERTGRGQWLAACNPSRSCLLNTKLVRSSGWALYSYIPLVGCDACGLKLDIIYYYCTESVPSATRPQKVSAFQNSPLQ